MSKSLIDYDKLHKTLTKKMFKLADVKDKIEKVAFDVVRFKDNDSAANLWQIQNADDGDYIVALYEDEVEKKVESNWKVQINKTAGYVDFIYKQDPIVRMSSSRLGVSIKDLDKLPNYLPKSLSTNKNLVNSLLNELSPSVKKEVVRKYPELS